MNATLRHLGILTSLTSILGLASCVPGAPEDLAPEEGEYSDVELEAYTAGGTAWSSPASWPGKKLPKDGADVVIPSGKTIILDTDIKVRNLQVDGTLICANEDLSVTANAIVVHGHLQCGTAKTPYTKRLTITLTGSDPNADVMGMGTKVIGAMGSGKIELHGRAKTSWVKLAATAKAGATTIQVDRPVNWKPNDKIVLASTDFDMNQAEERVVKAVNGQTITLGAPLAYLHWGAKHAYSHGAKTFELDERGEVGLMSRNIVIRGEEGSEASGFGGHVMVMKGASMQIANVELYYMGQKHKLGRYPLHWHMAGDVSGQYIQNSSIHHTFNRCITIHGADNALVKSNLCYDNLGHAFFIEDGVEQHNVLEENLGLVTRRPAAADAILPSDRGNRGADALGPATFWISNPNNTVRQNAAAGSDGSGFWYGMPDAPTGFSSDVKMDPSKMTVKEFRDNVSHSSGGMSMVVGASPDKNGATYLPKETSVFTNLTTYKGRGRGMWTHGTNMRVEGLRSADNVRGAFYSFTTTLVDGLIVGESPNVGTPVSPLEKQLGRSLADPKEGNVQGYLLYDGPIDFQGVHFAGFGRNSDSVYVFANNGGATQNVDNRMKDITFAADTKRIYATVFDFNPNNGQRHAAILDVDGSISKRPGSTLIPNLPMNTNHNCHKGPWTSDLWTSCKNTYGLVKLYADFGGGMGKGLVDIDVKRSDGPSITLNDNNKLFYQVGVIANQGYSYHYTFPSGHFPKVIEIGLSSLSGSDDVVLEITPAPAGLEVTRGGASLGKASSVANLKSGGNNRFFQSGSSLWLKLAGGGKVHIE
jgi:cell migration-inducing and hyaluronan-binding protein